MSARFDDPASTWDGPASRWAPTACPAVNRLLLGAGLLTSTRGMLVHCGYVRPAGLGLL